MQSLIQGAREKKGPFKMEGNSPFISSIEDGNNGGTNHNLFSELHLM